MSYKLLIPELLANKRLIIGLGSGRCGTTSLAHLLNIQDDSNITHEDHVEGIFGLTRDSEASLALFCLVDILARNSFTVGDIGYHWLKFIPTLMAFKGDKRFICLKRDKEETINSFVNYPIQKTNPMSNSTRKEFELYYDHYYLKTDYYCTKYPEIFKTFSTDSLNSEDGQRDILNFLGFANHKYDIGVKLNVSEESGVVSYALRGSAQRGLTEPPPPLCPHPIKEGRRESMKKKKKSLKDLIKEEMAKGHVYGHFC